MPEYLTVNEAAQRLRIGRVSLYALLNRGEIQSFTVGRSRRIPTAAIDAYVARRLAA